MRVLVPITYQYSVRYVLQTGMLERLAAGSEPVVALLWDDPALEDQLRLAGAEVVRLPPAKFGNDYRRLRRTLDVRFWRRLQSPSWAIDRRRRLAMASAKSQVIHRARAIRQAWSLMRPGADQNLDRHFSILLRSDTNLAEFDRFLGQHRIDAVLTPTPYHQAEELLLLAAAERGLRLVTSIISFDNITTRGWIPVTFDRYIVWSDHNRNELLRGYPEVDSSDVVVAGAPQFDFYHQPQWFWDESEWRNRLGIEHERPVILFGAGPPQIVPHEPQFVSLLDDAIGRGSIPGEPLLLVRRHPMDDPERWKRALRGSQHVLYDDPWVVRGRPERSAPDADAIAKLCSTLRHSDVQMSTSSTMTVDGAALDRPQVGPAFDTSGRYDRMTRDLYLREHWLPITASGGMEIAFDPDSLVQAANRGLRNPGERSRQRAEMVRSVTGNTDGRATERVVSAVLEVLS